jgi:hypothetical protein
MQIYAAKKPKASMGNTIIAVKPLLVLKVPPASPLSLLLLQKR